MLLRGTDDGGISKVDEPAETQNVAPVWICCIVTFYFRGCWLQSHRPLSNTDICYHTFLFRFYSSKVNTKSLYLNFWRTFEKMFFNHSAPKAWLLVPFLPHTTWGELVSSSSRPSIQPWIPVRSYTPRHNAFLSCANNTDRSWKPSITLCSSYCRRSSAKGLTSPAGFQTSLGIWLIRFMVYGQNPHWAASHWKWCLCFLRILWIWAPEHTKKLQGNTHSSEMTEMSSFKTQRHWVNSVMKSVKRCTSKAVEKGAQVTVGVLTFARLMTFRWYLSNLWKNLCSLSYQWALRVGIYCTFIQQSSIFF